MSTTGETILVTGGAGFIGRHLVAALLEHGHSVRVLDNLSNATSERAGECTGLAFIEADIRDRPALDAAMRGVDVVVHLAALVSVPESVSQPERSWSINVEGTRQVLAAAAAGGVRRLVYASSAAVYGDPRRLPISEADPCRPLSPYGAHKRQNELDAEVYRGAMDCVGLRMFNAYGEGQSPGNPYAGVITRFMADVANGQELTLHGGGRQSRDFIHVDDIVRRFIAALDRRVPAGLYNVASGRAVSLVELVEVLRQVCDRPVRHREGPPREGDIVHSVADTARLREVFGELEPTPLAEGLRRLWQALAQRAELS